MWRVILAGVVAAAASASAAPRLKDPSRGEAAIVGTWAAERLRTDGDTMSLPPGRFRFTFTADERWVQKTGGAETVGRYVVDVRASPAAIDLSSLAGTAGRAGPGLAIFRVTGDTLEICVRSGPGERPAAFTAGEGSGTTLMTFRRVKTDK